MNIKQFVIPAKAGIQYLALQFIGGLFRHRRHGDAILRHCGAFEKGRGNLKSISGSSKKRISLWTKTFTPLEIPK
jgi:hypothetical protein